MKNAIIMMWLVFAAFVIFPMATDYISGEPESEVMSIIKKEAEADDISVTATEERGNKVMYVFTVGEGGEDFGVAIFSRFGDNYHYDEGMMSNGEKSIEVSLDTGWDTCDYSVTAAGAEETAFERFGGVYRIYAIVAAIMVVLSVAGGIYGVRANRKYEEQRKKGLAA